MAENDSNAGASPAAPVVAGNRVSTMDMLDAIENAIGRAIAICSVVGVAEEHQDEIPPHSLGDALWAARLDLDAARDVVRRWHGQRRETREAANG